jgi:hypothetical protein
VKLVLKSLERLVERAHKIRWTLEDLSLRSATFGLLRVAALEALDAATGVDELLLASEEGVALVAELDAKGRLGRLGRKGVAARASNGRFTVRGVDIGFHGAP